MSRRARPAGVGRSTVLRPAQACLGRLRYSGKFLVIAIVLLIPVASAASASLRESREARHVLEHEELGARFIPPIARVAVGMYADREQAVDGVQPAQRVGGALDDLDRLATRQGTHLGILDDWEAARLAIEPVQWPTAPALPDADIYEDAALALRTFANQVADSSDLTLDGQPQSHYLAEVLLVDVPQVLQASASVHEAVRLARGHGQPVDREVLSRGCSSSSARPSSSPTTSTVPPPHPTVPTPIWCYMRARRSRSPCVSSSGSATSPRPRRPATAHSARLPSTSCG